MKIQLQIPQEVKLEFNKEDDLRQEAWDRSEEREEQSLDNYYDDLVDNEPDTYI